MAKPISNETVEQAKTIEPVLVSLDKNTAEHIYELYKNVEFADAHFKNCQSQLFRQHIQSVYKANNIEGAFAVLKAAIES